MERLTELGEGSQSNDYTSKTSFGPSKRALLGDCTLFQTLHRQGVWHVGPCSGQTVYGSMDASMLYTYGRLVCWQRMSQQCLASAFLHVQGNLLSFRVFIRLLSLTAFYTEAAAVGRRCAADAAVAVETICGTWPRRELCGRHVLVAPYTHLHTQSDPAS